MRLTGKDLFYYMFIGGICVPAFILYMIYGFNGRNQKLESIPMSHIVFEYAS